MSAPEGNQMNTATDISVLLEVREMRGQLSTFIQIQGSQAEQLTSVVHAVAVIDNRVTALEATRKVSPPWWATVGAIVPSVGLLLLVAERLYS